MRNEVYEGEWSCWFARQQNSEVKLQHQHCPNINSMIGGYWLIGCKTGTTSAYWLMHDQSFTVKVGCGFIVDQIRRQHLWNILKTQLSPRMPKAVKALIL